MSTLANLISDLSDTGPDTPVDPRQPGYALALLVEHASADGNEGYFLSLGERVFAALPRDATDTISEVARMLRAHEWRTESGGVRCRCRALLPTVTEYHDHQAAMLAEAGLLRPAGTDHLAEDLRENTEALMTARAQVEAIRAAITREAAHGEAITRCNLVAERFQTVLDSVSAP